ncbi:hypothetical protein [Streptobacillus moniliformis]|uniref:hypothetical protein n=1 Tax=Streptobacillus moniliformis TaxID=34105 RepID=UPI000A5DF25C|nr:hypothetical protein [Streptobacillus moniliformis]
MIKKSYLPTLVMSISVGFVIYLLDKTNLSHNQQLIGIDLYSFIASIVKDKLINKH